jgi:hypothetical protein
MAMLTTGAPASGMRLSSPRAKPALQKAEIEWKAAFQTSSPQCAPPGPAADQPAARSAANPQASATNTVTSTAPASHRTSWPARMPSVSEMTARWWSVAWPPRLEAMSVVRVMMPSPPSWMSTRITAWPKNEKSCRVERTAKPVTQQALVAVKMPSTSVIGGLSGTLEIGSVRTKPPSKIAAK